jgi:hypothetical protein
MSIKEELHDLVEQLSDEGAAEALSYVHRLLRHNEQHSRAARVRLEQRMEPQAVSGSSFFSQRPVDLTTLAAAQGVSPITNVDDLLGDFWPEDETADDFIAAVREWRREGGHA